MNTAKKIEPGTESAVVSIRITLTSLDVAALEKVAAELKKGAQDKNQRVKGVQRLPTKKLALTVRKSPCGNGTNSFDRYEMRIHKRVLDLVAPPEVVKSITSIAIEPGVDVEVHFT